MSPKKNAFTIASLALSLALLASLFGGPVFSLKPAEASNGISITIFQSNVIPTMDGICDPAEYADAYNATINVGGIHPFTVFVKHTASDAYFCFGDSSAGVPLPNGGTSSLAVYVDPANDGVQVGNSTNDFGVWMPYDPIGTPWSNTWLSTSYIGPDPGGWQAVKHQVTGTNPSWSVEIRISSATLGGWNHAEGLALFYHWWQSPSNDYSWPADGIWGAPQNWANVTFSTVNLANLTDHIFLPAVLK